MNNLLVLKENDILTMSSREIGVVVESRHDKVKQSIDRLAERGVIGVPQVAEYKVAGSPVGGAVGIEYFVSKRDSYIIVAQLSPEFTARLVDRWQELEKTAAPALPQSFAQALRLAAEQAETIEAQTLAIAAAAPAVEFVAKYADSTGLKGFRQVCKLLGVKENLFRDFLADQKIMYKLGGEWVPHAAHLDAGRFEVKAGTAEQNGHAYNSARFTPKGVTWVAGEWAKFQIREMV